MLGIAAKYDINSIYFSTTMFKNAVWSSFVNIVKLAMGKMQNADCGKLPMGKMQNTGAEKQLRNNGYNAELTNTESHELSMSASDKENKVLFFLRENSRTVVWLFSLSYVKVQNVYVAYWLYYVKFVCGLMAITCRPLSSAAATILVHCHRRRPSSAT